MAFWVVFQSAKEEGAAGSAVDTLSSWLFVMCLPINAHCHGKTEESENCAMNICSRFVVAGLAIIIALSSGVSYDARAANQKHAFEPTMADVSHLSCEEIWIGVAEKDKAFLEVVELFAHHILTRREVKFPGTPEAGKAFGDAVVKNCLADPEELLYSIVNRSLRDTLPVKE